MTPARFRGFEMESGASGRGGRAVSSDFWSQQEGDGQESPRNEGVRRLGESQELLTRLLGRDPELGAVQGEEGVDQEEDQEGSSAEHQEGAEGEVSQEGGLQRQGEGPGGSDEEQAAAEEEEVSTQELQWRLARLRSTSPDMTVQILEDSQPLQRLGEGQEEDGAGPGTEEQEEGGEAAGEWPAIGTGSFQLEGAAGGA